MHADLATRRRLLVLTYQRYQEAERAWTLAAREMRSWFPIEDRPTLGTIGSPESMLRRVYDARSRALLQLQAAHQKYEVAKVRLVARQYAAARNGRGTTLCLTVTQV